MGLVLIFWSPLRARLHIVPKLWTRTGRTARTALLAPFAPANGGDHVGGYDRKRRAASGGVADPSMAPMRKPICRLALSAIAASRPYGFIPISSIEVMTASTASGHWSPPSPAIMTSSRTCSASGQPRALRQGAISLRPRKAFGRVHGRTLRFGGSPSGAPLLAGNGIETVLSLVTAVDRSLAESALLVGSHGTFKPPHDFALLVIAPDKDMENEHAANRLQHLCDEGGIPSIVIFPEHSDFNDDLIAFGEETLSARIAPLIASTESGGTVEERRGSGRIISPS